MSRLGIVKPRIFSKLPAHSKAVQTVPVAKKGPEQDARLLKRGEAFIPASTHVPLDKKNVRHVFDVAVMRFRDSFAPGAFQHPDLINMPIPYAFQVLANTLATADRLLAAGNHEEALEHYEDVIDLSRVKADFLTKGSRRDRKRARYMAMAFIGVAKIREAKGDMSGALRSYDSAVLRTLGALNKIVSVKDSPFITFIKTTDKSFLRFLATVIGRHAWHNFKHRLENGSEVAENWVDHDLNSQLPHLPEIERAKAVAGFASSIFATPVSDVDYYLIAKVLSRHWDLLNRVFKDDTETLDRLTEIFKVAQRVAGKEESGFELLEPDEAHRASE
jgi:hypothetical protein